MVIAAFIFLSLLVHFKLDAIKHFQATQNNPVCKEISSVWKIKFWACWKWFSVFTSTGVIDCKWQWFLRDNYIPSILGMINILRCFKSSTCERLVELKTISCLFSGFLSIHQNVKASVIRKQVVYLLFRKHISIQEDGRQRLLASTWRPHLFPKLKRHWIYEDVSFGIANEEKCRYIGGRQMAE